MVKVSVLIPVYNVSKFLDEAISSILNQNFEDIELICVNDGSTDNSLEILESYASKDDRLKIFTKENGGCGSARNMALAKAEGEFVYFFDPDDRILQDTIKHSYENAVANNSDIVLFKATRFDEKGVNYNRTYMNLEKHFTDVDFNDFTFTYKDIKDFFLDSPYAPWCKLYRKSFLDSYDDFKFDLGIAFDDVPFHVKSLARAERLSFVNEYLYHYRFDNPDSVNHTASNSFDIFKIVDIVESILKSETDFEELEFEFNKFLLYNISYYLVSSQSEEYFNLAKERYLKVDEKFVKDMPKTMIKKYYAVINNDSYDKFRFEFMCIEYDALKESNDSLRKSHDSLRKSYEKLKDDNYNLRKSRDYYYDTYNELISSNSWKLTKPLREIKNFRK